MAVSRKLFTRCCDECDFQSITAMYCAVSDAALPSMERDAAALFADWLMAAGASQSDTRKVVTALCHKWRALRAEVRPAGAQAMQ